jgi:ABC-2 type transport system permease protein
MIVFKNYLKIVKKYIPIIIVYTIVFIFFSVITTQSENTILNFEAVTPNIAIINNDGDTKILNTFINYLSQNANIVEIQNDEEAIQDALFFREISCVLIIPQNYTEDMFSGKNPEIEIKKTEDGNSTYVELIAQRFLKITNIYIKTGMSEDEICTYIVKDLENQTTVTVDEKLDTSIYSKVKQYYNFSNYIFLSLCILIISEVMTSFKDTKIKKRNLMGTISYKKINIQIFLGNLCVTLGIWMFYVLISIALYGKIMLTQVGLLLILNALVFCITASAIGFLIANIVKSRVATNGIVNVISLGLSFISGSFVPQKYLGSTVLGIAKIFPSYWFITNNNKIVQLNEFNFESLKPIISNMGIVAVYVLIIFLIIEINKKNLE